MGMVTIQIRGSFGNKPDTTFSAMEGGHAAALGRAIAYLTGQLESAIQSDHRLHDEGQRPPHADFGKRAEEELSTPSRFDPTVPGDCG